MNKIFASALVAATFAVSAPAMAATQVAITETVPGYYTGTFTTVKSNDTSSTLSFTDDYFFNVPGAGKVGASVISLNLSGLLTLTEVLLNNTKLTITRLASGNYSADGPTQLSVVNPQTLVVKGTLAPGAGSYTGNVAFTAGAVPEPATWALMILGFGVVGYAMRRRPSVRFAQAI